MKIRSLLLQRLVVALLCFTFVVSSIPYTPVFADVSNYSATTKTTTTRGLNQPGYFYDQLTNQDQKNLYLEMAKPANWFTGNYTGPKITLVSTYNTEDDAANAVSVIAKNLVDAVSHDQPEIFWLDWSRISFDFDWDQNTHEVVVYPSVFGGANAYHKDYENSNAQNVEAAYNLLISTANEIVAAMPSTAQTVYEKADYLNWWLIQNNVYPSDTSLGEINNKRTAYNALLSKKLGLEGPVCIGYSYGMQLLCKAAGLESIIIDGTVIKGGVSIRHGWNRVQNSDGKWYDIDVTWNDSESYPTKTQHFFFMVGKNTDTLLSEPRIYQENHHEFTNKGYPTLEDERLELSTSNTVAQIGNIYYTNLADAFAAAMDNDTIKLLNNVTASETFTLPDNVKSIVLDLNGKTITTSAQYAITIPANSSLTIVDSTATSATSTQNLGALWLSYDFSSPVVNNLGHCTLVSGRLYRKRGSSSDITSFFTTTAYTIDSQTSTAYTPSVYLLYALPNAATAPTITITLDPNGYTYTGSPIDSPTVKRDGNGLVRFHYSGRNNTTYNSVTPPTDAGDYTVTVTVEKDAVANLSEGTKTADFSIAPCTLEWDVSNVKANSIEQNTADLTAVLTGTPALKGVLNSDDVSLSSYQMTGLYGSSATVGSVSVALSLSNAKLSGQDAANYSLPDSSSLSILGTVTAATPVVTPTPTPVVTPTATPVVTPTATPVVTPTATPVVTPTATPVATPTATPVVTPTATPVVTPTATPVVTPTATPVVTPTATPVVTPTATPVVTPTATPVVTPTATPVVTPTATPVVTPTATPVVTPTATPVVTPTATPVVTPTATPVVTPTATPVVTPTATPVVSQSSQTTSSSTSSNSNSTEVVQQPTATPVATIRPSTVTISKPHSQATTTPSASEAVASVSSSESSSSEATIAEDNSAIVDDNSSSIADSSVGASSDTQAETASSSSASSIYPILIGIVAAIGIGAAGIMIFLRRR